MCSALVPDVCKVPPGIPTPFPNFADCANADTGTCSQRVKIRNKHTILDATEIPISYGDEPGVMGGVVSGTVASVVIYKSGSASVRVEGRRGAILTSDTAHNGRNANAPVGKQVVPSQMQVFMKG